MPVMIFCGLCQKPMDRLGKNDRIAILELNAHRSIYEDSPVDTVYRCRECGLFIYLNLGEIKKEKRRPDPPD